MYICVCCAQHTHKMLLDFTQQRAVNGFLIVWARNANELAAACVDFAESAFAM